jgi:FkbM family methyltransferase
MRRKHTQWHYARRILRAVWDHPANAGAKSRAVLRAGLWQLYKRVAHGPLTVSAFGSTRLRCYPDSTYASNRFYFSEWVDFTEMRFISRYLRSGDGFIDGGANIGMYTLLAASLVGNAGRVDTFEPFPLSAERLRENVALNRLDNVTIHQLAISDAPGTSSFLADVDVSNRMAPVSEAGRETIDVATATLDDVLGQTRSYSMAKLDLEGAELLALRGAQCLLASGNPPVWQLELKEHLLERQGGSVAELILMLRDYHFACVAYDLESARLEVAPVWPRHGNVLAVHSDALQEVRARVGQARPGLA